MIRSDGQEIRQVKVLGQGHNGGAIEVLYITHEMILYHCSLCTSFHEQPLIPSDHDIDWFRFTCNTCGEESKRIVNLSRVLMGTPVTGPKIMSPPLSPSEETAKKGKRKK